MTLRKDRRVVDFCGEDIKPGWLIKQKQQKQDNWVKYELTVKGYSGKLKTTVIGDYLKHSELEILEQERVEYFKEKEEAKRKEQEAKEKGIEQSTD